MFHINFKTMQSNFKYDSLADKSNTYIRATRCVFSDVCCCPKVWWSFSRTTFFYGLHLLLKFLGNFWTCPWALFCAVDLFVVQLQQMENSHLSRQSIVRFNNTQIYFVGHKKLKKKIHSVFYMYYQNLLRKQNLKNERTK